jgi:hypothetical protein
MSYFVGAVIGNFILTVSLVLLSQGIGTIFMIYFKNKQNSKNNVIMRILKERCGFRKDEDLLASLRRVFATSYVSLTLFFCSSFLMTPTLSSGLIVLVAAKNDPKLENHEVSVGFKIISILLSILFCGICVGFVVWSVWIRNNRKEKYQIFENQSEMSFVAKLLKAEGEWKYPNPAEANVSNIFQINNYQKNKNKTNKIYERSYLNFLIAEPTFESYRDTIWFSIVEVVTAILIALPPFFAQFVDSAKGSCLVQGILLAVILFVDVGILIWKNPFKLKIMRIMKPILSLQQLAIVVMVLVIVMTKEDGSVKNQQDLWLWKVIVLPMASEGAMGVMMMVAAFFPILAFVKKLKGRINRKHENVISLEMSLTSPRREKRDENNNNKNKSNNKETEKDKRHNSSRTSSSSASSSHRREERSNERRLLDSRDGTKDKESRSKNKNDQKRERSETSRSSRKDNTEERRKHVDEERKHESSSRERVHSSKNKSHHSEQQTRYSTPSNRNHERRNNGDDDDDYERRNHRSNKSEDHRRKEKKRIFKHEVELL